MDFQLNDEHKMVEKMVYDFTRKEVMPVIKDYDRSHEFPKELARRMGELGFLGICLPARYDGGGMDYISLGIVSEGLEFGDSSLRETVAVHLGLHALPILQWGTDEQKETFLPPLATGELLACFGLTEPNAGSDVAGMQSTARRDGDDYILNGEKMWITLSDVADRFLVFAKTDPDRGSRGITAFILERGWQGLTTGTIEGKMGVHASNTGWISMADVRVPPPATGWVRRARASRSPWAASTTPALPSRPEPSGSSRPAWRTRSATPRSGRPLVSRSPPTSSCNR